MTDREGKERCPVCGIRRLAFYDWCPKCGHHYDPHIVTREFRTYLKCKDCVYLNGDKRSTGIRCTAPDAHRRFDESNYKQPTDKACKKLFKGKEEK